MATLKNRIFYLDRGAEKAAGLDEFLSSLRPDSIVNMQTEVQSSTGRLAIIITYFNDIFKWVDSSPTNGEQNIKSSSKIYITFDESIAAVNKSVVLANIELQRNGTAIALAQTDISLTGSRLTIMNAIDATALAFYQLIIRSNFRSDVGRVLGNDRVINWKTAA